MMMKLFLITFVFACVGFAKTGTTCLSFYSNVSDFKNWDLSDLSSLNSLSANQFFPTKYLQRLSEANMELILDVSSVPGHTESVNLSFLTKDRKHFVANVAMWKGSVPSKVVLEHLETNDPLVKVVKIQRQGKLRRGLDKDTFFHVRNQLFSFLKHGGFTEIEINSTQDLLVYMLYKKVVGAEPISPMGQLMSSYVEDLAKIALRKGFSIDALSNVIGTYLGSSYRTETGELWGKYKNDIPVLEKMGFEFIKNESNENVGFLYKGQIMFFVPFLSDKPLFFWRNMYEKYPEAMYLSVDLNK